jgi:PAS domain S-box-containing protein
MSKKPSNEELLATISRLENQIKSLETEIKKRYKATEDLSERLKAEEELQLSEEKFFKAFHSNPALMAISTFHDAKYIDVNDAFLKKLGYKRDEIIGHSSTELQLYVDIIQSDKFFQKLQRLSKVHDFEVTINTKAGETRTGLFSAETIMLQGEPCLLTIINDITELKKAESIRQMIHNISNAVITCKTIDDLFQTIREELSSVMDTTNFFIALYDKETDTMTLPFFKDEKDNFQKFPPGKTITAYVMKKGKSILLGLKDIEDLEKAGEIELVGTASKVWIGVPLRAENEIIGVISLQSYKDENAYDEKDLEILEFISNQAGLSIDRKRAEQNLLIAKQKSEDAAKAKQQFLSTMSHEIRAPLNTVLGTIHLLLQENPRSDQMEYLNSLKFSGENLLVLINDILDLSKIESGMVRFEQSDFDVTELINDIKQSFLFKTEEKGIELKIHIDPEIPELLVGDPMRLTQILTNLTGNAVKFTEKGSITMDLNLKKETAENVEIEFSISDTGIGIPKSNLKNIFESFTQASTDTTRKYGGTGLGLAITKKLIELQNRKIFVKSVVGKGSKFYFSLNFPKIQTNKPVQKLVGPEVSYNQLKGLHILVAEDNEINYIVAKKLLEKWGVVVDHAENGKVAIDKLNRKDYDIVLMDLNMPVLSGYEASKIIRNSKNEKCKNIPILALTASMKIDIQQKIEKAGITEYILKPFNPNELYDKILSESKKTM